eukprot:scaffold9300_cov59-Phaeocystis_antarctica.AAC.10
MRRRESGRRGGCGAKAVSGRAEHCQSERHGAHQWQCDRMPRAGLLLAEWCEACGAPHPVEGIRALVSLAAVDGDLAADQEDEQRDRGPQDLLLRFVGGQGWAMCTQAL